LSAVMRYVDRGYKQELKRNQKYFEQRFNISSKFISEMLMDCLIGYSTIDRGIMAALSRFDMELKAIHNKNVKWSCSHYVEAGGIKYKYNSRPDSGLYLDCGVKDFNPLLITAEYKRKFAQPDYLDDWTKLSYQLIFSGHMLFVLNRISSKPISEPICLYGWLIPGARRKENVWNSFILELYKLEFSLKESNVESPEFRATLSLVKAFPIREFDQVVALSFLITLNAVLIAEKINGLELKPEKKTKIEAEVKKIEKCDSIRSQKTGSRSETQSRKENESPTSPPPSNTHSNAALLIAGDELENVRNRFCHSISDEGIEYHPLGDLIFDAQLPGDKTHVVVKVVSKRAAGYVQSLSKKFTSPCEAKRLGLLMPLKYVPLREDSVGLVMEEVTPLSFWDDLTTEELLNMASQLLCILKSLNAFGIVHGDLKLSNMGMTEDGLLVLFDWEDRVRGTTGYMAPELNNGEAVPTHLSDLYSAGMVLKKLHRITIGGENLHDIAQTAETLTSKDPSIRQTALETSSINESRSRF
jgi:hypothetical protein